MQARGHIAIEEVLKTLTRMEVDEDELLRTHQGEKDFEALEEEVDLVIQHHNLVSFTA